MDEEGSRGERWSYHKLAQRLARYGVHQTRQNLHKKVRSEASKEAAFTANELLAFSLVFDRPIVWFLLPQEHHRLIGPGEDAPGIPADAYLNRLLAASDDVRGRLVEYERSGVWDETADLFERFVSVQLGEAVREIASGLTSTYAQIAKERLAAAYTEKDEERAAMTPEERAQQRAENDAWIKEADARRKALERQNEELRGNWEEEQ
jgi:hypothetical protein